MKPFPISRGVMLCFFCLTLAFPSVSIGMDLHFESETRLRGFERDTPEDDNSFMMPAYEYLQLDVSGAGIEGLSFHAYGWGRANLGNDGFYEDDTSGEFLYGYFEYVHPDSTLNLKLGRFYIFEGFSNESIDGLRVKTNLGKYFTFSAYGGQSAALDNTDGRGGDSISGGRIAHRYNALYEIGTSYKVVQNDNKKQEEQLGFDVAAALPGDMSLYGFSTYNLESEGWAEHSWELRFSLGGFHIRPFFEHFQYQDYFDTGANTTGPFPFLRESHEELSVYGIETTKYLAKNWEGGFKAKAYEYEMRDSSQLYTALLNWYGEDKTSVGVELSVMQGDAAKNDYLMGRLWFYYDPITVKIPSGFFTGDLVVINYNEEIHNEDTSLFLSFGVGNRYMNGALELEVSADYSADPFFDDDLRGMFVARYLYDR